MEIDITLNIRWLLSCALQLSSLLNNLSQTCVCCRCCLNNRTSKLLRQCLLINLVTLLLVDITFIQCDNHRNSQLQKLCCKE